MLPSTPQVEAVYLDESTGILSGLTSLPANTPSLPSPSPPASPSGGQQGPQTILIDQTTLDPTAAVAVAERTHDTTGRMALMLDAPVSGGEPLGPNHRIGRIYDESAN